MAPNALVVALMAAAAAAVYPVAAANEQVSNKTVCDKQHYVAHNLSVFLSVGR